MWFTSWRQVTVIDIFLSVVLFPRKNLIKREKFDLVKELFGHVHFTDNINYDLHFHFLMEKKPLKLTLVVVYW